MQVTWRPVGKRTEVQMRDGMRGWGQRCGPCRPAGVCEFEPWAEVDCWGPISFLLSVSLRQKHWGQEEVIVHSRTRCLSIQNKVTFWIKPKL